MAKKQKTFPQILLKKPMENYRLKKCIQKFRTISKNGKNDYRIWCY